MGVLRITHFSSPSPTFQRFIDRSRACVQPGSRCWKRSCGTYEQAGEAVVKSGKGGFKTLTRVLWARAQSFQFLIDGISTTNLEIYMLTRAPRRRISLLRGTGRAITKCDLTDWPEDKICTKNFVSLPSWAHPILLKKKLSQVSTHGLDPTGLKWRRPEIAHRIQEKSFVRGTDAAMTPPLGSKLWVKMIQSHAKRCPDN